MKITETEEGRLYQKKEWENTYVCVLNKNTQHKEFFTLKDGDCITATNSKDLAFDFADALALNEEEKLIELRKKESVFVDKIMKLRVDNTD